MSDQKPDFAGFFEKIAWASMYVKGHLPVCAVVMQTGMSDMDPTGRGKALTISLSVAFPDLLDLTAEDKHQIAEKMIPVVDYVNIMLDRMGHQRFGKAWQKDKETHYGRKDWADHEERGDGPTRKPTAD